MRTRLFSKSAVFAPALLSVLILLSPTGAGADCSSFWPDCTVEKADKLAMNAGENNSARLTAAAACYASVVICKDGVGGKLDLSRKGRHLARLAVGLAPDNAKAQFVLAVLIGLVAQNDPFYEQWADGLDMVPKIQEHASIAAKLDPKLNFGGPDRILGELYMRAPEPPLSIGDPAKAIAHLRKAVKEAPAYPENRYELAKALLKRRRKKDACAQLQAIQQLQQAVRARYPAVTAKAAKIFARHCDRQAAFE